MTFLQFLQWASHYVWTVNIWTVPRHWAKVVYGGNWLDAWHYAQSIGGSFVGTWGR